ncbi:hypothetical protein PR048_019471 [Dryococelus australis]|uniref:Uncharacterized protein n=1 Tax=Dryococelus australis TaxID=614101 RepID=A0ABQ9H3M8_9NEOP|nr:hypothetical protein PR048_019471 [Dryococelus australis]
MAATSKVSNERKAAEDRSTQGHNVIENNRSYYKATVTQPNYKPIQSELGQTLTRLTITRLNRNETQPQADTNFADFKCQNNNTHVNIRFTYSPPTKVTRVRSSAGSLRIFACENRTVRCCWSAGFLGDLPFPPPFHSGAAPYSLQSPTSTLKTSMLRAVQISSLTQMNRAQSQVGSLDFRIREPCRTMPLVGWFSRGSPIYPALLLQRRSTLTSITIIGYQDLDVKSRPNLFTHSFNNILYIGACPTENIPGRHVFVFAERGGDFVVLLCSPTPLPYILHPPRPGVIQLSHSVHLVTCPFVLGLGQVRFVLSRSIAYSGVGNRMRGKWSGGGIEEMCRNELLTATINNARGWDRKLHCSCWGSRGCCTPKNELPKKGRKNYISPLRGLALRVLTQLYLKPGSASLLKEQPVQRVSDRGACLLVATSSNHPPPTPHQNATTGCSRLSIQIRGCLLLASPSHLNPSEPAGSPGCQLPLAPPSLKLCL